MHESTSCAHYLLARGVLPRALLKEVSSYDTVGNAFFSLTIHALPAGWRRLAVVTSDFHMPRTAALFRDMYGLAGRELYGQPDRCQAAWRACLCGGKSSRGRAGVGWAGVLLHGMGRYSGRKASSCLHQFHPALAAPTPPPPGPLPARLGSARMPHGLSPPPNP